MRLYDSRAGLYEWIASAVRYPQAAQAAFRASQCLRQNMRILDAGCGSGISTLALLEALHARGLVHDCVHAFDLNQTMLSRFYRKLEAAPVRSVSVRQADVLNLGALPDAWTDYDLIVSAGMLEHLDLRDLPGGLSQLHGLLAPDGWLLLLISKKTWISKWLVQRWWRANVYTFPELHSVLAAAGFAEIAAKAFPKPYGWLNVWVHVIEARRSHDECKCTTGA